MLKNDYIMRMIMEMTIAIRAYWGLPEVERKDHLDDLEEAVGNALNIDPKLFFSLEPDSQIQMMKIGDCDESLAKYVVHTILLEAKILEAEERMGVAQSRREQAVEIAKAFGVELPAEDISAQALVDLFDNDFGNKDSDTNDISSKEAYSQDIVEEQRKISERYKTSGLTLDDLKMDDL